MSSYTQPEMLIVIEMSWGKNQFSKKQHLKHGPIYSEMMSCP